MCGHVTTKAQNTVLLDDLKRVARLLGRRPTVAEYGAHGRHSHNSFYRVWGNWESAINAAGLHELPRRVLRRTSEEEIRADLERVAREIGRPPSMMEYRKHGRFSESTVTRAVGPSWHEVLVTCLGLDERAPPPYPNAGSSEVRRALGKQRFEASVRDLGGQIAAETYDGRLSRVRVRCSNGHEWVTTPARVYSGSWCRQCWNEQHAGQHLKLRDGLEQARRLAARNGGECLSTTYELTSSPMRWRCQNGHEWSAALGDVKKGTWCPDCNLGVRERACRAYLEALTGHAFPRARPKWLINARGHRMELDGWCRELSVAFEHHGAQHYATVPHFQRRKESLERRIADDCAKRAACATNGVGLIEIPFSIPASELPAWLHAQLLRLVDPQLLRTADTLDLTGAHPAAELLTLRLIAASHGGECLSPVYLGTQTAHRFRCAKGHEWEARPSNIAPGPGNARTGTWCPFCKPGRIGASNRKHTTDAMRKLAAERGGEFLSTEFRSVNERYLWRCAVGHEWSAAPVDIMKGTWCRRCMLASRRHTLEDLSELARSRGGQCLSDEYRGSQQKHRWRCANGHEWEARPDNIRNSGSWCPRCARRSG